MPASLMDCLDLCCGEPSNCSRVCRHKAQQFVQQVREIGGFDLDQAARAPLVPHTLKSDVVPLIYHGSRRAGPFTGTVVALRLADLVNYKTGLLHHAARDHLCQAYQISSSAEIILTGVNHDRRIEPWWSLGEQVRIPIIEALTAQGIRLVTAPNFSVLLDNPRTDDLHAMKRIAIVFAEFQRAGMVCALHPNSRTLRDFERWGRFIACRPEVTTLAYEFITGSGTALRREFHLNRLAELSRAAGRNLDIIVRGDPKVIPFLRQHFRSVIYIETTSFLKTLKRKRATRVSNSLIDWVNAPTVVGETLENLLQHNVEEQRVFVRARYYGDGLPSAAAA